MREEGQEVTEEEKKEWEKRCEEIKVQNAENEKTNEEIAKFQAKIKIEKRQLDLEELNEVAIVKLNNFREPK